MRTSLVVLLGAAAALIAAAPAQGAPAVALTPGNGLVFFDTATPGTIERGVAVVGLGAGEALRAIDVRPATGQLFGVSVTPGTARTYVIDPATGKATFVGSAPVLNASNVPSAVDFNPVVDRIRFMNADEENARLNPNNGALAGDDTNITGANSLIAAAYTNNVAGATVTTLFAIDRDSSSLVTINPPNNGTAVNALPLGVVLAAGGDGGMDIAPDGTAYAALTVTGNVTQLRTVNLATGATTLVGAIGTGTSEVQSLAILPARVDAPTQTTTVTQTQTQTVFVPVTPAAPAAIPDREAPFVLLAFDRLPRLATLLRSRAAMRFSCSEACAATATLRSGRTLLTSGRATLRRSGVATLRFSRATGARARAIRRLRRSRRARVTLAMTVTDAANNRRTVRRTLTLAR